MNLMLRKLIFVSALTLLGQIHAATHSFVISSNESFVTISGTAAGFTIQEQASGSLTTHFSGQVAAGVSSSNIVFSGGSSLDALTNGTWQPMPGGNAGQAPADFGGKANVFGANVLAAFRNIVLDLQSGSIPLKSDNSFDASSLVFVFPTNGIAAFDYNGGTPLIGQGSQQLSGYSTNRTATTGSITQSGASLKLTIPISAQYQFKTLSANDSTLQLTGQLVGVSSAAPAGPSFVDIKLKNQNLTLVVQGTPNQPYRLESSADLTTWSPRGATVATTPSGQYTYTTTASGTREFFRLVE